MSLRIRQAGNYPVGDLIVDSFNSCCGKVCGGVGVTLVGHPGGWVMDRDDIIALAKRLQEEPMRTAPCYHHRKASEEPRHADRE